MKRILIVSVALCALSAHANETVFGDVDCGTWVTKPTFMDRTWLIGYISGMNAMFNSKVDPLKSINSGQKFLLWMDNWCRANPLKKVSEGATEMYGELLKDTNTPNPGYVPPK